MLWDINIDLSAYKHTCFEILTYIQWDINIHAMRYPNIHAMRY